MIFFLSLSVGLAVLLVAIIFLIAVFYHLFQYQLPNNNHKKAIAIITIISIIFIFVGYWIFSNISWEIL